MSAATEALSALDAEAQCVETVERARRTQLESRREVRQAESDYRKATADREAAVSAGIRGERDADERMRSAAEAIRGAAARVADAQERGTVAAKVERDAEARRDQIRTSLLDDLVAEIDLSKFEAAQAAAEEPLRDFMREYNAIRRRMQELEVGTKARVEALDRERNYPRSNDEAKRESQSPPCPITPALLSLALGLSPMPPVLADNYQPGAPLSRYVKSSKPEADPDAVPKPLFRGDPGYEIRSFDDTTLARP